MIDPPPSVLERLGSEPNAWMCTLRTDGSPHLTPVWFVYQGRTWWVCSGERNVKVRNVAADPRVSLALEGGGAPVVAEGQGKILRQDYPADVVAAFKCKYGGWDITTPFERGGSRVLLEVPVDRWLLAGTSQ